MSTPTLTTKGLKAKPTVATVLQDVQWADATGSADIVEAAYPTAVTELYDGLILGVRFAYANETATPIFAPDEVTGYTIVKLDGQPLQPGDIAGDGAEGFLRFNDPDNTWQLLNPTVHFRVPSVDWSISTGSADALSVEFDPPHAALVDGLTVKVRANHDNTATDPTLDIDGFPPFIIYRFGQQALEAGNIKEDQDCIFVYHDDGTDWWELLNPAEVIRGAEWVAAGGTVNVITAAYNPAHTVLVDGDLFAIRCTGPNTISGVTFNPNGLGAKIVYKQNKLALAVNDLALNYEALLRFHDDVTDWYELLNPNGGVQTQAVETDDTSATDVNTALGWFPAATDAVILGHGTEYEFEGILKLSRAAGTTSHTTGILFGGTATFDYFVFEALAHKGDDLAINDWSGAVSVINPPTTSLVCKAASTSASEQTYIKAKGRFKVAAAGGGTLIPQFILSAAAGGISTRKVGTRFTVRPTPIEGTWA